MAKGKLIVIEGADGSGKATQSKLLMEWLTSLGHQVMTVDFPRHTEPSAYFVERYLAGAYGDVADSGPYQASLFYALDRFEASFEMKTALGEGKIIVADRYVGSNMGHQGSKLDSAEERHKYFTWNEHLEYEILGIPRPDLNIFLQVPPAISQLLMDKRGRTRDLHERDAEHLERAAATFAEICELFPDSFTRIDCTDAGKLLPIEAIRDHIRTRVAPLLA